MLLWCYAVLCGGIEVQKVWKADNTESTKVQLKYCTWLKLIKLTNKDGCDMQQRTTGTLWPFVVPEHSYLNMITIRKNCDEQAKNKWEKKTSQAT